MAKRQMSLVSLALTCVGLLFGGVGVGVVLGGMMPLPYGSATDIVAYVRTEPVAVQVMATAVFASSVSLLIYVAAAATRLRRLGAAVPAVTVALTAGTLAAGSLGLTALLGWTLSRPDITADAVLARAIYLLVFLVGGPGHIVALGLLVGGMAVACVRLRLLPLALTRTGLAIAALCEVATFVLAWPPLGLILPIARVAALVWLVAAAALLPRVNLDPV
jgi:hypothetical protein